MLLRANPKKFYNYPQAGGKAGAGGGGYAPQGVRFNGTTTTFKRSGSPALTGAVNGVKGILSFWFLLQGATDGTAQYFCTAETGGAYAFPRRGPAHDLLVNFRDAGSADSVATDSSLSNYTTSSMAGVWSHFIASWDGSIPRVQVYLDGVSILASGPTITNVASNYATTDWAIGGRTGASAISQMDMADFYFNQTTALDLGVPANVQKFRDASGNAVDLGATGSLPTGAQPILCFTGGIAGWATNKGSGGNFTSAGTFANSPTSPP